MLTREQWDKELEAKKWLSKAMKREALRGNQGYGRYVLEQTEKGLKDVIELSPGTYRWSIRPSKLVIDAAKKAMEEGYTEYAFGTGLKEFRNAIAEKLQRDNDIKADPETQITPTSGCTHAFDLILRVLVDPGDEVLMIDPDYGLYYSKLAEHDAKVVPVPLKEPDKPAGHWTFDPSDLEKRVTPKTKMFVFSNGNNPTGMLYGKKEIEEIAEIATKKDILVVADELYERLTFDGREHYSIASFPGMEDRTITLMGFSKVQAMSGFRVGFMVANKEITRYLKAQVAHTVECVNTIGQMAAIAAMSPEMNLWVKEVIQELTKRRNYAVSRLNNMRGITCGTPMGCFFMFPNTSALGKSHDVAEFFLREAKIRVPVGTNYGPINGEGHIRVTFAAGWDRLAQGLDAMNKAAEKLMTQKQE